MGADAASNCVISPLTVASGDGGAFLSSVSRRRVAAGRPRGPRRARAARL